MARRNNASKKKQIEPMSKTVSDSKQSSDIGCTREGPSDEIDGDCEVQQYQSKKKTSQLQSFVRR